MPSPPSGVLERLNYVKDFFFDPCDAPFTLYVETMLPALLEAALLWYTPVPDEIFIAWARPSKALSRYRSSRKGTRGSKGGRRPRFGRLGRFLAFDVNEFIGKRLPGAELLSRGGINGLNWWLWRIFAFTQLLGLIWLVWEVVSGFFAKWFSLLYETEYCQASARTIIDAEGFGQPISNITEWSPLQANTILKQRGPASWSNGGGSAVGKNVKIAVSFTKEGAWGEGATITLRIGKGNYGQGAPIAEETFFMVLDGERTYGLNAELPDGGPFWVQIGTNVNFGIVTKQTFYLQGGPA